MKASKKWLNEYVECLDIDVKDMEKALTMTGTKVEQIDEIGKYNNIVIGKILEITKHENAEKLVITKVDIGDEIIQIVTGAKNISVRRYYYSCKDRGNTSKWFRNKKRKIKRSRIKWNDVFMLRT